MRKIVSVILVLVLVAIGVIGITISINKYKLKKDVEQYLLNKGYTNEQIESIETVYSFKLPPFTAKVIFSDEKHVTYYYLKYDEVRQYGNPTVEGEIRPDQFKHLENIDSVDL